MNKANIALIVALVAVVIAAGAYFGIKFKSQVLGSTSCANITCISGGLRLVTDAGGDFESDVAAVFASTISSTGVFTDNGGILNANTLSTTTTATTQTLVVSDVQGRDTVIITPTVGSDTITLFASSTASTWLPTAGNSQTTCFVNGTTTSGINLTFAGGTGTTLLVASSSATALGSKVIGPQKIGCFRFVRGNATATTFDIIGAFTSFL